jgi:hypothetical protein
VGSAGTAEGRALCAALARPADSATTSRRTSLVKAATAGRASEAADDAAASWISRAAATNSAASEESWWGELGEGVARPAMASDRSASTAARRRRRHKPSRSPVGAPDLPAWPTAYSAAATDRHNRCRDTAALTQWRSGTGRDHSHRPPARMPPAAARLARPATARLALSRPRRSRRCNHHAPAVAAASSTAPANATAASSSPALTATADSMARSLRRPRRPHKDM